MNIDNKTTRELAIGWFNSKASLEKTRLCDTNTEIVGTVRRWETLTGREIELIYLSEHPTETESKGQEPEVDLLDGITPGEWNFEEHDDWSKYAGNIVAILGKNERGITNIRTIDCLLKYTDTVEEAKANGRIMASAPRLAQENKELKEQNKLLSKDFNEASEIALSNRRQISKLEEQNKELREALEMVYKRLHIFGESNVWEDEDEMALHRAQKALTQ